MGVLSCIEISLGLDHIVPIVPGALFDSAIFSPSIEEGAGFLVSLRWAVVPVLEVSWQADRKTRRKKKKNPCLVTTDMQNGSCAYLILFFTIGMGWGGRMVGWVVKKRRTFVSVSRLHFFFKRVWVLFCTNCTVWGWGF